MMRRIELYRCLKCRSSLSDRQRADALCCAGCQAAYPVVHNVLDALTEPSPDVIQELQANAREQGLAAEEWRSFRIRRSETLEDMETRLAKTASEPGQYYQQVTTNFAQAVERLGGKQVGRVLEIGADFDYHFLKRFRRLGAECFAVNIRFSYMEPDDYHDWPEKTLADMNDLPFVDGVFDVVLLSATSHHSSDLPRTIREIARVMRQDGVALVLNDPLRGWLKWMGCATAHGHGRDDGIHENEYTLRQYDAAFRRAGLAPEHLFSAFHDRRLSEMDLHPGMRFARLARLIGHAWSNEAIRGFSRRRLLRVGQTIFGFPLNVILSKSRNRARPGSDA